MIKNCLHCDVEFSVKPSHYDRTKYCSLTCRWAKGRAITFCVVCGKEIVHKAFYKGKRKYCSQECFRKSHERIEKECIHCHKKYKVYLARELSANYCSRACRLAGKHVESYIKICHQCGKEYKVYGHDAPGSKYCSRACYHLGSTEIKHCEYCGVEFTIKKSSAPKRLFCSKACANSAYRIRYADMTYDKVDNNQDEIVEALRKAGASVISLSSVKYGCPDLLVGFKNNLFLLEVKSAKGTLTSAQKKFFSTWQGQAAIVRTPEEALSIIGAVEYSFDREGIS